MTKAKNQTKLVINFVNGETSGTIGHLLIFGDTLYNTENDEFLPVCRKLGPAGNDKIFCINEIHGESYHGMYRYHKTLIMETLDEARSNNSGMPNHGGPQIEYVRMQKTSEPTSTHPIDKITAEELIKIRQDTALIHERMIDDLKAGVYEKERHELGISDEHVINVSQDIVNEARKFSRYLKADMRDGDTINKIRDIELLVNAPEIMKQAIEEGGIDPNKLKVLLATRDRVKETIEQLEDYISIILAIPSEPTEAHSPIKGNTISEIIVDDQMS